MNRRQLLLSAGALAGERLLAPVKALAAEVKAVRIKDVETFNIEIPATPTEVEAGVANRLAVTRVSSESGVHGYSFGGPGGLGGRRGGAPNGFQKIRDTLIGGDLFAIEHHLK